MQRYGMPKGYDMIVPFPPGSGDIRLTLNGETIRTFPYSTTDETIFAVARLHSRFGIFEELKS